MPWTVIDMQRGGPTRRGFLAGAATMAIAPGLSWADAGGPRFLAAARMPDETFELVGLSADLAAVFAIPLPGRGHAAAAHPERPLAVAFARRPGLFAVVIDCALGATAHVLSAPKGRHFYGHGVFSADGALLFTTENDFGEGRGVIGVWATDEGFRRINEFPSNGIGPHDIQRLPGTNMLVVANGGIDTHPETGREKLNLPTMRSNISFLTQDGQVLSAAETPPELRLNSMRHLAVARDGTVAVGCQWQGDIANARPLVGLCHKDRPLTFFHAAGGTDPGIEGYIGSIAISDDALTVVATAPRGDRIFVFDRSAPLLSGTVEIRDVCGVAARGDGFAFSTGFGELGYLGAPSGIRGAPYAWDNHLILIEDRHFL